MHQRDRITHVLGMMGGRATIRGMRVTVEMILNQLSAGRPLTVSSQSFRTSSAKTSCRPSATERGWSTGN